MICLTYSQQIQLDATQHDALVAVAQLRAALPSQLAEHEHFFAKRLTGFVHFVRVCGDCNCQANFQKKQQTVLTSVTKCLDKLKVLQTFANPVEVGLRLQ